MSDLKTIKSALDRAVVAGGFTLDEAAELSLAWARVEARLKSDDSHQAKSGDGRHTPIPPKGPKG